MGGAGGDVYIRERGYLSVHCLVTGHGPGPGTLAALPMHALSWTLEAALGQCSHAIPYLASHFLVYFLLGMAS